MTTKQRLRERAAEILGVAAKHGARNLRVFGSFARGEDRPDSDIDLLVDMEPGRSLFDLADLKMDLQELLGTKVDIVTDSSIHWLLRRRILREATPL